MTITFEMSSIAAFDNNEKSAATGLFIIKTKTKTNIKETVQNESHQLQVFDESASNYATYRCLNWKNKFAAAAANNLQSHTLTNYRSL